MMKKTNLITLLLLVVMTTLSSTTIAGIVDYEELFKRKLAVELLDESEDTVVRNYNATMKSIVSKYWKLNSIIEFKTEAEITAIREQKNNEYVLLYVSKASKGSGTLKISNLTLNYSRAEQPVRKSDYVILSPQFINKKRVLEHNMAFTINYVQKNIKERIKTGKRISPKKFAGAEADRNCGELKSTKTLIVRSHLKKGVTSTKLRDKFSGKFKTVKASEIMAIVNEEKAAFTLVLPTGMATSSSTATVGMSATEVIRLIVNCDGEVLGCAGINPMYKSIDPSFSLKDFKTFGSCL